MAKSFNLDSLVNTGDGEKSPGQGAAGQGASKTRSQTKPKPDPEPAAPVGPPKRLSLSLDAETYRQLRLHAVESDRTHQDILADAARAYLRKHASK